LEAGYLTAVLLASSFAITILTNFGTDQVQVDHFDITRYGLVDTAHFAWNPGLPEICHGQIWRLFTPIFIHFGIAHLLVNSIWIFIFGTLIEKRQGFWVLIVLVLVIAVLSNLAQYWVRGPAFGGMSGVICGLLGYIFTRNFLDPATGLRLDWMVLAWALFWTVASSLGLFGHAGQICHAAGLIVGSVAGVVSSGSKIKSWWPSKR
jgi:GlpG protein